MYKILPQIVLQKSQACPGRHVEYFFHCHSLSVGYPMFSTLFLLCRFAMQDGIRACTEYRESTAEFRIFASFEDYGEIMYICRHSICFNLTGREWQETVGVNFTKCSVCVFLENNPYFSLFSFNTFLRLWCVLPIAGNGLSVFWTQTVLHHRRWNKKN